MKNKQYKIEKGLMLFTQPRSPYFYGKIRHGNKYLTKSFAPISNFEEAKSRLQFVYFIKDFRPIQTQDGILLNHLDC